MKPNEFMKRIDFLNGETIRLKKEIKRSKGSKGSYIFNQSLRHTENTIKLNRHILRGMTQ